MPLLVGWHLAIQVFLPGITLRGGGALAHVWSYGEALALVGSHPRTVMQAPLRS
jgi:hypothetical protein